MAQRLICEVDEVDYNIVCRPTNDLNANSLLSKRPVGEGTMHYLFCFILMGNNKSHNFAILYPREGLINYLQLIRYSQLPSYTVWIHRWRRIWNICGRKTRRSTRERTSRTARSEAMRTWGQRFLTPRSGIVFIRKWYRWKNESSWSRTDVDHGCAFQ